ncbi:MAG TPA: thioredoxin domain-containing protein [Thermodesulfovibrionales bacterium]|nr:thioredoxin domain-containing protein [Thermodesulfovibrionales bacterium]
MANVPFFHPTRPSDRPNRLSNEKSPYLLQHARNPVDWYPWGPEPFERAAREDKPVFLSIGYSTCHWCHVMEKESFEDDQVAALLNESFISVKVDREERPDIDGIYMTVCQMLTGSGGWPLTIIMTPEKKPFFAGTYFPKESRFGRIGMLDLIPRIREIWRNDREKFLRLSAEVTEQLRKEEELHHAEPSAAILDEAFGQLQQLFDEDNGGFGPAPKFPAAHMLLFLLRYGKRTGAPDALRMTTRTLDAMRNGGMYDHAGFGFHRYSTDAHWLVPHFEKMLYDQAMLCMAYTEAFQATADEKYRSTAEEIITYVLRDMTSPEGGFCSAEDADSEGEEGKFYVWSYDEISKALGQADHALICSAFGISREGNFTDPVTGDRPGTNILHRKSPLHAVAAEFNLSLSETEARIRQARATLFAERGKRIHPHKDDKVLTDWNGLMITALARAARAFQRQDYEDAAVRAADFIIGHLRRDDGVLLHRYRDGDASLPAHLDDYAFFISGLIELYEATFDPRHLKNSLSLNDVLLRHYWDPTKGGFFFTADNGEDLLVRKKEVYDSAMPSGNAVAVMNLLRLARMIGDASLEERAAESMRALFPSVQTAPSAHASFLCALDLSIGPSFEVVIVGNPGAEDTRKMLGVLQTAFLPSVTILFKPADETAGEIMQIAEFTRPYTAVDNCATAYVCRERTCFPPTTDPEAMLAMIQSDRRSGGHG